MVEQAKCEKFVSFLAKLAKTETPLRIVSMKSWLGATVWKLGMQRNQKGRMTKVSILWGFLNLEARR